MIQETHIVVFYLVAILLISILFKPVRQDKLKRYILSFIFISVCGEALSLFYEGYNLLYLSILNLIQLAIISAAVYSETSKKSVPLIATMGGILFFVFLYFTTWSSISVFDSGLASDESYPIGFHQFFDLFSVINIGIIALMFQWLWYIVFANYSDFSQTVRRYLFVLAFLVYSGGTFFMVAFGRIILSNFEEWHALWVMIFYPIVFIFYTLLFIGLLWKSIRS